MRAPLIIMFAVAASFAGVIAGGFWLRPRMSGVPDSLFGLAAALTIAAVPCVVAWFLIRTKIASAGGGPGKGHRKGAYGMMDCSTAEQIAYRKNRRATATCVHLRAIEQAMRNNPAIEVDLLHPFPGGPTIRATCRIHESALRSAFALPPSMEYREEYYADRGNDSIPTAHLICTECRGADRAGCIVRVLHPDECYLDTPWLPSPPARG